MSNLRRCFQLGDTCFITCITYNRTPLLIEHFDFLRMAIERTHERIDYKIIAQVILPEHFHLILINNEGELSNIMQRIKMSFAALYRANIGISQGRVWQNRFWDHIIRKQNDLNRYIDYIHYNPVKHRLIKSPFDWPYSSIHEYRQNGIYQPDWGSVGSIEIDDGYGE